MRAHGRRGRARRRPDRRPRQLGRRRPPLCAGTISMPRRGMRRWTRSTSATSTRSTPCCKRMAARGRGAIVNIIGSGGKVANPVHLPGGAANAALMLATAGLAAAFAPKGIRINGINPGATLTGRVQEGLRVEAKMTGLAERRIAEADAGEDSARPARHAGGGRARRALPRVRRGELRDRCDRADGRRIESGHLISPVLQAADRDRSPVTHRRAVQNGAVVPTRRIRNADRHRDRPAGEAASRSRKSPRASGFPATRWNPTAAPRPRCRSTGSRASPSARTAS